MKSGFTLVELIIAVAIGMMMTGMGVISLNNFNAKQELKATKSELVALLRQARNYAKTQQRPVGFTGTYRGIDFTITNGTFNANIKASTGCLTNCVFIDNKDISPTGISSIQAGNRNMLIAGWVIFSPYEAKSLQSVNPEVPQNSDIIFTIRSSKVGDTETVIVSKLGQIDGQ
jgi:type II secretory pathway pseudopilin PulG